MVHGLETIAKINDQVHRVPPLVLDEDLRWILSRPNFWCAPPAQVLREDGHLIKTRAEDEQAAVIHWLLNLYLVHGQQWREIGLQELARIKEKVASREKQ